MDNDKEDVLGEDGALPGEAGSASGGAAEEKESDKLAAEIQKRLDDKPSADVQGDDAGQKENEHKAAVDGEQEPTAEAVLLQNATDADREGIDKKLPKEAISAIVMERVKARQERERMLAERERARNEEAPGKSEKGGGTGEPRDLVKDTAGVFSMIAKAQKFIDGGGFEPTDGIKDEAHAKEILSSGRKVLSFLNDDALLTKVVDMARKGELGADGEVIEKLALKELPLVQSRKRASDVERERERAAATEHQQKISSLLAKEYEKWPEIKPVENGKAPTKEALYVKQWLAENVGTAEKPGPLAGIVSQNPDRLPWLFEKIRKEYDADQATVLRAERDKLRKEQERREQPLSGGAPRGDGGGMKESDKIKEQLREKMPGFF